MRSANERNSIRDRVRSRGFVRSSVLGRTHFSTVSSICQRRAAPLFFMCLVVLSGYIILSGYTTIGDGWTDDSITDSHLFSVSDTAIKNDPVRAVSKWLVGPYQRRDLLLYVYDLPRQFNQELVEKSVFDEPQLRDPWCNINFYSADDALTQFIASNKFVRTLDAYEADYFWVPVYTTCFLITHLPNDLRNTGDFFAKALQHISVKYPFWNRSGGSDHLFAFTQGQGARLAGDWRKVYRSTFLVHNGDFSEDHFRRGHDIVIPPNLASYVRDPASILRKQSLDEEKRIFAFFGGQIIDESVSDHRGRNHSHGVRQFLKRHLSHLPDYHISDMVRDEHYVHLMSKSQFCLCPEGWHKWSPRPYYAVLVDCIPVVISSRQELALNRLIAYDKFAVYVHPSDVHDLDRKLRAISRGDIIRRRIEMRRIWRLLHYGRGGLAREAVLYELWMRKHRSKSQPRK